MRNKKLEVLCEMSVLALMQHKDWSDIHKSCFTITILFIPLSHTKGNTYGAMCEFVV